MATAIVGNFIVGKKPEANSPKTPIFLSLQPSNKKVTHNLFTILACMALDNMWVICESRPNSLIWTKNAFDSDFDI
jgi:hypothetical protein